MGGMGSPGVGGERDFTCSRPAVTARGRSGSFRASAGGRAAQPTQGGHRCVPSSLTTVKVSSVGAHHAASLSQEAPLSFIYYLFHLVAAPTSASCYKKRSKTGLGTLPASSVCRGGKGPLRAATTHREGARKGLRWRCCHGSARPVPLPSRTGYKLRKK